MQAPTSTSEGASASFVPVARHSTMRQLWGKCKSFRHRKSNSSLPDDAVVDVRFKATKTLQSGSFRLFNKTRQVERSCLCDDDDDDCNSDDLSVNSAPVVSATKPESFTMPRRGSFEIRENKKIFRNSEETITFHPSSFPSHKKSIQAASSAGAEATVASQRAAEVPRRGIRMKLFGAMETGLVETSEGSHTESSSDSSSQSEEADTESSIAKQSIEDIELFDPLGGKVSFGISQVFTVPSWKGEDLWWTKRELRLSHVFQSSELVNNDRAKRYLQRYEEAQEEILLSQIYNLDGKPHLEKLPGGVKRGLREGFAGLEVFSLLENRRRVRCRAIVRSVVELSLRTDDSIEVGLHAQRLNAPSLEWAALLARAHQLYDRLLEI